MSGPIKRNLNYDKLPPEQVKWLIKKEMELIEKSITGRTLTGECNWCKRQTADTRFLLHWERSNPFQRYWICSDMCHWALSMVAQDQEIKELNVAQQKGS